MKTLKLLPGFAFLIVFCLHAQAQQAITTKENKETLITLSGVVYDPLGSLVVKAKVTAKTKNDRLIETTTNDDGIFELRLLSETYQIEVESPGFKISKLPNYKVVNTTYGKMNQDIVLEVRDCNDCEMIAKPIEEIKSPR